MTTFKDSRGNEYSLDFSLGNLARVKKDSEGRFDLFAPFKLVEDIPFCQHIYENLIEFYELAYLMVESQAKEKYGQDSPAEQFAKSLTDKCLVEARTAFFKSWINALNGYEDSKSAVVVQQVFEHEQAINAEAVARAKQVGNDFSEKVKSRVARDFDRMISGMAKHLESDIPTEKAEPENANL
jgi:hypothetical protein